MPVQQTAEAHEKSELPADQSAMFWPRRRVA
jgi:hypothetical protein